MSLQFFQFIDAFHFDALFTFFPSHKDFNLPWPHVLESLFLSPFIGFIQQLFIFWSRTSLKACIQMSRFSRSVNFMIIDRTLWAVTTLSITTPSCKSSMITPLVSETPLISMFYCSMSCILCCKDATGFFRTRFSSLTFKLRSWVQVASGP